MGIFNWISKKIDIIGHIEYLIGKIFGLIETMVDLLRQLAKVLDEKSKKRLQKIDQDVADMIVRLENFRLFLQDLYK